MKNVLAALSTVFTLVGSTAQADVWIQNDPGGKVGDYADRVARYAQSGERVRVSGFCFSACTMYLRLPRSQICAMPGTVFGFHQAYDHGEARNGAEVRVPNAEGTAFLKSYYPRHLREAIGRLPSPNRMKFVSASHLVAPCR